MVYTNHHRLVFAGSAFNVVCMNCRRQVVRHYYQTCLTRLNPHLTLRPVEMRPDGDVDLTQVRVCCCVCVMCCDGIKQGVLWVQLSQFPCFRIAMVAVPVPVCSPFTAIFVFLCVCLFT
ncbi:hypothetical protein E2C01_092439 [Portunus trituberculatus]|uniref:Uncharacterized protein n=1 Tax=Portunus trituberculatus TaxID=210409 RepID=A0A5B7JRD9_PORTR|nr:hypothetical protein [Portunus trituberculatus]